MYNDIVQEIMKLLSWNVNGLRSIIRKNELQKRYKFKRI